MKQQWVDRFKPLNPNLLSNMREEENKKNMKDIDYWRKMITGGPILLLPSGSNRKNITCNQVKP